MTPFFQKVFTRYPIKTRRFFEILPGFCSWTLILFPLWGALFFPAILAYFILFFDVYWLYKSFSLVITAFIASRKIEKAEKRDYMSNSRDLSHLEKVVHVLVLPNYKENITKLRKTLEHLTLQTFPLKKIFVVLAMEERETDAKEKAQLLQDEFKNTFGDFLVTFHPDVLNEVKGKSSNEAYAGRVAYDKYFIKGKHDINYATITAVDADSLFDPQYFAYLTYEFLRDPKRYNKFWQSAIVFYSNIWHVPAATRIISFFGSLWRISLLVQGDKLLTHATYSLSFKLLRDIDFWDVDVIPEDYRVFFKAFYKMKGELWAEPIFLKTSVDAAQSSSYIESIKNKYHQERRWSWGVSDDPLFIKWWFTEPGVPFMRKTSMLYNVLLDHLLWPVNWFIITIAANIVPFINPVYSRTQLGYQLPQIAGTILTSCLIAIVALMFIDYKNRPKNVNLRWYRKILFPFEFILMPVVGFFLSALPALISHTELMFGKRLEYRVTEKV